MNLPELVINLGEARTAARYMMNAIEEWRKIPRDVELSEQEKYALRFMYGSARKILEAAKRVVDEYHLLRRSDKERLAGELGELAATVRELEGNLSGAGNNDVAGK